MSFDSGSGSGSGKDLVVVSKTNHSWMTPFSSASFILEDGNILPDTSGLGKSLFFRLEGLPIDPRLKFYMAERTPTANSRPSSMLEFRPRNACNLQLSTWSQSSTTFLDVHFEFESAGGVTVNTKQPLRNDADESLRKYMLALASPGSRVKFSFEEYASEWTNCSMKRAFDTFVTFASDKEVPWRPYHSVTNCELMTQYSQLMSRNDVQKQWNSQKIQEIPASDYFYDPAEAAIKLVYGAVLEDEVAQMHLVRLSKITHKISLIFIPGSNQILGAVSFGRPQGAQSSEGHVDFEERVADLTRCEVIIEVAFGDTESLKCKALSVPNIIGLGISCSLVLMLSLTKHQHDLLKYGNSKTPRHEHGCTINFEVNPSNVMAQVNGINKICSIEFSRWHPILLNQEYTDLPPIDVFQGIPATEIQTAYDRIYQIRVWNTKQQAVFKLLRHVPGHGFAFFEGIFGCGKTLVQVTLAKLLVDLGQHVLIVAPTNGAVRALSSTLAKNIPDFNAVRVVCDDGTQMERFLEQEKGSTAISYPQSNDSLQDEADSHAMFHVLNSCVTSGKMRYDVEPHHDLHHHVENLVRKLANERTSLWFSHAAEYDERDEEWNPIAVDKSYDAVEIYLQFKDTNFQIQLRDCEDDEKKAELTEQLLLFRTALGTLRAEVVSHTKVLLCTQQLAASSLIKLNFASRDTNGIVIIADEDGQALEPVSWIPVALLESARFVKAVLRFGDCSQLAPLAFSATTPWNEFAPQINRSLLDRHLRQHPPAVSLDIQYRMHPTLSAFPNSYTYAGRLKDGPGCSSIRIDEVYDERLKEWGKSHLSADVELGSNFSRLLGVRVIDSACQTDKLTRSRFNKRNAATVRDMLFAIFKSPPYPLAEIVLITPYTAQRALYYKVIRDLHIMTNLPLSELPRVATIDSMQGHEADIVILDWVNARCKDLGFLRDDRRINVALTRCRASLVVVSADYDPYDDDDDDDIRYWQAKKFSEFGIIKHWTYLKENGLVIDVDVD